MFANVLLRFTRNSVNILRSPISVSVHFLSVVPIRSSIFTH